MRLILRVRLGESTEVRRSGPSVTALGVSGLVHAGCVAAIFLTASSTVPAIGASGAIAGVLGGYLLLFPRARVLTVLIIILFVTIIEIPAAILLAIWFFLQFLPALGQVTTSVGGGEGIAYWAHVGGFVFGLAAIRLFANRYPGKALGPPGRFA